MDCPLDDDLLDWAAERSPTHDAGELQKLLTDSSEDILTKLRTPTQIACKEALARQGKRILNHHKPKWNGATVVHPIHGMGTVETVHRPLPADVIADVRPVTVEFSHGEETVATDEVERLRTVTEEMDAKREEWHELTEVLDAGIVTVEDRTGESQTLARAVRDSLRALTGNPDITIEAQN